MESTIHARIVKMIYCSQEKSIEFASTCVTNVFRLVPKTCASSSVASQAHTMDDDGPTMTTDDIMDNEQEAQQLAKQIQQDVGSHLAGCVCAFVPSFVCVFLSLAVVSCIDAIVQYLYAKNCAPLKRFCVQALTSL